MKIECLSCYSDLVSIITELKDGYYLVQCLNCKLVNTRYFPKTTVTQERSP